MWRCRARKKEGGKNQMEQEEEAWLVRRARREEGGRAEVESGSRSEDRGRYLEVMGRN